MKDLIGRRLLRLTTACLLTVIGSSLAGPAPTAVKLTPDDLLARLTLAEKLSLLDGDVILSGNGTGYNTCEGHTPAIKRLGIPALCMGDGPGGVSNGVTGVTQFPAPIAAAASWDLALTQRLGAAIAAEQSAKGRNVLLAPTINILRSPLWGRGGETFGEDPFLTGKMGVAEIQGMQSQGVIAVPKHFAAYNQETQRFGAAPQWQAVNAIVSGRALHEIFFPAFHAAVADGHAAAMMCAYNQVNFHYACENPLFTATLRQDWGFKGFVVSDWYFGHRSTIPSVVSGMDISMPGGKSPFGFADFYGAPLRQAVQNGSVKIAQLDDLVRHVLNSELMVGAKNPQPIQTSVRSADHLAVARDVIAEATVLLRNQHSILPFDGHIHRIAVIGDAAINHPATSENYGGFVSLPDLHPETILDALRARAGKAIAITAAAGTLGTGPLPAVTSVPDGFTAHYFASPNFTGAAVTTRTETQPGQSLPKNLPATWSARWQGKLLPPQTGDYRFSVSGAGDIKLFADGKLVAQLAEENFHLTAQGMIHLTLGHPVALKLEYSTAPSVSAPSIALGWQPPDDRIAQAAAAARNADAAVVVVSDLATEGADRTSLALPGDQDALIAAVTAANPNTVVVLNTVGPVLMPWRDHAAAILAGWYGGEQSAPALASLLFGDTSPSGHLPMSFPASDRIGPSASPASFPGVNGAVRYTEGLDVGYRWYDDHQVAPLYPFGFGLTYTSFAFRDLAAAPQGDGWQVSAELRNTGSRAGTDVAQLYLGFPKNAGEPPHQLAGFARITLAPGASQRVSFHLTADQMRIWDETKSAWRTPSGTFRLFVGDSSRNLPLSLELSPR